MSDFKRRFALSAICTIWILHGTQLPEIQAHKIQFLILKQVSQEPERQHDLPSLTEKHFTSGNTMVKSKLTTTTSSGQHHDTQMEAIAQAIGAVQGTAQKAQLARELLAKERQRMMEEQEA